MNGSDGYSIVLFHSVHHALRAEKLLRGSGCSCKIIPIPRNVSSDCGVCVRISSDFVALARETLGAMQEPWRIESLC